MTSPYQHRINQKARLAAEFAAIAPDAAKNSLVASFHEIDPDSGKASIVAAFKADEDREASDRNLEMLAWCHENEAALVATSAAINEEWGQQILADCQLLAEARAMFAAPARTASVARPKPRAGRFIPHLRTTTAQKRQALLNDRLPSAAFSTRAKRGGS